MTKISPLRKKAYAFLRWRFAKHGIPSIDLRKEGRGGVPSTRNEQHLLYSDAKPVDIAFMYHARGIVPRKWFRE